ncbi:MAG: EAL domain-containing protein [Leptolyngbyaceae cyanobacterium]
MTSHCSSRYWRLLPGAVSALATFFLSYVGVLSPLENSVYQGLFRLRGEHPWDDRIVLITVNDKTLAELKQYPLSREHYAELLQQLAPSQPAAIGFNILFVEPSPADSRFAAAIAAADNVVLATAVDAEGTVLLPVKPLRQAANSGGHILRNIESDGLVHQVMPQRAQHQALSLALAELYAANSGDKIVMPLSAQPIRLNWPGQQADVEQYSLIDVLQNRIQPSAFAGKIVLVGMSATGTDSLPTPFDRNPPASGLALHAALLDNVLQQRSLRSAPEQWWLPVLLLLPGISYWLFGQPFWRQCLLIISGGVGGLVASLLLFQGLYWVPIVPWLVLWGLVGVSTILSQQFRAKLVLQHLLEDVWQQYRQDANLTLWPTLPQNVISQELGPMVYKLAFLANSWGWAQETQSTIAQTVPIGLVAADDQMQIWFCNTLAMQWLQLDLKQSLVTALTSNWLAPSTLQALLKQLWQGEVIAPIECQQGNQWFELRFEQLAGAVQSHQLWQDERQGVLMLIEDVTHRKAVELELRLLNQRLEDEVRQRTAELETTNLSLRQEISERRQAQQTLAYRAQHDQLTALPNRFQLETSLKQLIDEFTGAPNTGFAVLFIDCDRFKLVNDSFGHLIGDQLLQAIAHRLSQSVAHTDLVARFGGDEFVILLKQLANAQAAIGVAQRIRNQLQSPFLIQGKVIYTGCSIGVVVSSRSYQQADEMLRDADIAMYRAKQKGNDVALFRPEMHLAVRSSLQLETELRSAVLQQDLVLHYQPIFKISTYQIVGFEALLRWHHPQRGIVSPDKFIPLAEDTGMIIPIGRWVMQEACQQLKTWQTHGWLPDDAFMSINLSVRQFNGPSILEQVDEILNETGLKGQHLKLEITESVIMADLEMAMKTFKALKDRGISLGIDDFGTGYSSLSYLHSFPVDTLKVDRAFIQRMTDSHKHLSLVQAIKTLSQQLEMTMVAEGIENVSQLEHLKNMRCSLGQGYLFCAPMDKQALEARFACV